MTELAVQRFYESESKVYDETRFKSSQGKAGNFFQKLAVMELVGNCKGKRILEIGSGTGRFSKELSRRGAFVVCVDLSRKMHEQSRHNLRENSIEYNVMNGLYLGFADGVFDACITVNMMSHIKDDIKILSEVNRVLRKGGFLVSNFPNLSGIYFPIGVFVNLFNRSLQLPVYSRWYSIGGINHSLRNSGLVPTQVFGLIVLPKKYCPNALSIFLRRFGKSLMTSQIRYLFPDLIVKSYNSIERQTTTKSSCTHY